MLNGTPGHATAYNPSDLLTTNEAAKYLNLSPKTLNNKRCRGDGPAWVRVGKRSTRYRFAALEDFIAASTAGVA